MKRLFKTQITLATLLIAVSSHAQVRPTLEWTLEGSNNNTTGISTAPIVVTFLRDNLNYTFGSSYSIDPTPLIATVRLQRQQYSTTLTGTSTVVPGLSFGTRSSTSNASEPQNTSPVGVQSPGVTEVYNVFGAPIPTGQPRNSMYLSSPDAPPVGATSLPSGGSGISAGGFDVDGVGSHTGSDGSSFDQNFGIVVYTTVEPLHDINANPAGRFYYGDLVVDFNRPVKNPVIHVGGLGGSYEYAPLGGGSRLTTYFTSELELVNGITSNAATFHAGNLNLNVAAGNKILNSSPQPNAGSIIGADAYGAASGSIRIEGTYSKLVFKVFMKGTPGNFGWSQDQANITAATRDPFNGDVWCFSISTNIPNQLLSGFVFYDTDSISGTIWQSATGVPYQTTDGSLNGSTLESTSPGLFWINLVDQAGNVVQTTQVGKDGSYSFENFPPGTYRAFIGAGPGTIGQPAVMSLPPNWINTGQLNGLIPGITDGVNDGISAPVVVNPGDQKTNINFGVINGAALSVHVLNFAGQLDGSTAKLTWIVTNEFDVTKYTLERSVNGTTFTSIANVTPIGTLGSATYNQNDNVLGLGNKIYYRLRITNKDGSVSYSNIVVLKLNGVKFTSVYPNPFLDAIRIDIDSKTKDNAVVRIIDVTGQTILTQVRPVLAGSNQITISGLGKLAQGSYMLEVKTSTETYTEKLVKKN